MTRPIKRAWPRPGGTRVAKRSFRCFGREACKAAVGDVGRRSAWKTPAFRAAAALQTGHAHMISRRPRPGLRPALLQLPVSIPQVDYLGATEELHGHIGSLATGDNPHVPARCHRDLTPKKRHRGASQNEGIDRQLDHVFRIDTNHFSSLGIDRNEPAARIENLVNAPVHGHGQVGGNVAFGQHQLSTDQRLGQILSPGAKLSFHGHTRSFFMPLDYCRMEICNPRSAGGFGPAAACIIAVAVTMNHRTSAGVTL
ncbi:hypothetical protein PSA83_06436 (plasmid) [Pseudomonas aeruginosa]|nr:hypothetical protein PSA83_06436 [Pseudomonas aeruginosa]